MRILFFLLYCPVYFANQAVSFKKIPIMRTRSKNLSPAQKLPYPPGEFF
jgi:hypothetical protein